MNRLVNAFAISVAALLSGCGGAHARAQLQRIESARRLEVDTCEVKHDGVACMTVAGAVKDARYRIGNYGHEEQRRVISERERHFYRVACDANVAAGCLGLTAFESDHKVKLPLLQHACELGDGDSCFTALASIPTAMASTQMAAIATLACDHNRGACGRAAATVATFDPQLAKTFLQRACDHTSGYACAQAAANAGALKSPEFADLDVNAMLEQACSEKDWESCTTIAKRLWPDAATHSRAIDLLRATCNADFIAACSEFGTLVAQQYSGTVEGKIVDDKTDQGLPDFVIILSSAGPARQLADLVKADGTFRIVNVPAGTYSIEFRYASCSIAEFEHGVTVRNGKTTTLIKRFHVKEPFPKDKCDHPPSIDSVHLN